MKTKNEKKLYQRDLKSIDKSIGLLEDLCNSLNRLSELWLSHFKKQLDFSEIPLLTRARNTEQYLKEKWIESDPLLSDLVSKSRFNLTKAVSMVDVHPNPALFDAIHYVKKFTVQVMGSLPGIVADYNELFDGKSFVVSDGIKESIIERHSTYVSSEQDTEIITILEKICEGINELNWLGCGIQITPDNTTLGSMVDKVDTGVVNNTLSAYRGFKDYHIMNYKPANNLLNTDLFHKAMINLAAKQKK
jgi:hypothetical protein